MSEEELIARAKKADTSVKSILKSNMDSFLEAWDEQVKYRPLD